MDFASRHSLAAPRAAVWRALNDPAALAACVPGCERFEADGPGRFTATVAVKVGSLAARFAGTVTVSDAVEGEGCTLAGQGQGGVAGFARGSARLKLEDGEDGGTLVSYDARAEIGGRLASVGGRLLHGVANRMAEQFFAALDRWLRADSPLTSAGD